MNINGNHKIYKTRTKALHKGSILLCASMPPPPGTPRLWVELGCPLTATANLKISNRFFLKTQNLIYIHVFFCELPRNLHVYNFLLKILNFQTALVDNLLMLYQLLPKMSNKIPEGAYFLGGKITFLQLKHIL